MQIMVSTSSGKDRGWWGKKGDKHVILQSIEVRGLFIILKDINNEHITHNYMSLHLPP